MQLINREQWEEALKNNAWGRINDYGGAVLFYCELWAMLMEAAMVNTPDEGVTRSVADVADQASSKACEIMGHWSVTGFQHGAAVLTLAKVWEHGEELRKWHNLTTAIGDEGAKANESGGVLNPALLTIKPKGA